jgi:quinohemoprotein ethanol dehydrogenase
MQAPKNGFFYVLDRLTGKLISAEKLVNINWATGIDRKTGRPIENPAVRYGETPVLVSPGPGGVHNWNPIAYSPRTGLVYLETEETYMGYSRAASYDPDNPRGTGLSYTGYDAERKAIADYADAHSKAWLTAWNPVTQKAAWRVQHPNKGSGGVLATAGNLVFQGSIGTSFVAYRADTGAKLWEMPVQQIPISGPISYMVDGEQYVAVNAGWGGGLAHVERSRYAELSLSKPRLLVFKLNGAAKLPKPSGAFEVPELRAPPPVTGTPEQIAKGEKLYEQHCALCHGSAARGGIKDLRHMQLATHVEFLDIVLAGKRAQRGMASFADILSREDAEAIHHYVTARANADWEAPTLK